MKKRRCYGCMKNTSDSPICDHCGYDLRATNANHTLPAGTILRGQYMVGKVLGQGGFGITYLGLDTVLDIPVAIKEYYPSGMVARDCAYTHAVSIISDDCLIRYTDNRDRFLREARILAQLEDVPEVVQVKNFFAQNNTAYIIMGFVSGITLMEHIHNSGNQLTITETLRLITPLMDGLEQVHRAGLVHRDISPDNLMLQANGKLRLIDFGSAHTAIPSGDKSTQAILKHGFAPPEQYQRRGKLGPWTDVYALCATIYCCLTGKTPPTVTDRLMGMEDFDWDGIPGLTASQKDALRQGLELSIETRTQSVAELRRSLVAEPLPPEPSGTSHPGDRSNPNLTPPRNVHFVSPVKEPEAPPAGRKPTASRKGILFMIAILTVVAAIAALAVLPARNPDNTLPSDSSLAASPANPADSDEPPIRLSDGSRTLCNPDILYSEGNEGVYLPEKNYAFGTDILRSEVLSITTLDTLADAPENALDASANQDGSVLVWAVPNGNLYDLYLAADGVIFAPVDSFSLFAEFSAMEHIDLTGLRTGQTQDMGCMFDGCVSLRALDLSNFDTARATNMAFMFGSCVYLEELALSGFDTANVDNMNGMFYGCSSVRELDLSAFDTRRVTQMCAMFSDCVNLEEVELSGFDTGNVTHMDEMFRNTPRLENVIADFDVSQVESYAYFMDSSDTVNGHPWQTLFP